MKLAIITAIHGRPLMTEAFLKAMARIRKEFDVKTYAVTSELNLQEESKGVSESDKEKCLDLLYQYNIDYVEYPNYPNRTKWNRVVQYLRYTDFTHLLILGSDDIPSSRFIEHTLTLDKYNLAGLSGLWFWGLNPRRAGFERFGYFGIKGSLAGAGKLVGRDIVEASDYALWSGERNSGMDANMMNNIRDLSVAGKINLKLHRYSLLDTGGFLMDVKYGHHISSMSPIIRHNETKPPKQPFFLDQNPYEILPDHLPEDEVNYLKELHRIAKEKKRNK